MPMKSQDLSPTLVPLVPAESKFNYDGFPPGYYQDVFEKKGIRAEWHIQKFDCVRKCLPAKEGQSLLDIGCFSGTLLASLDPAQFSTQVGIDILPKQIEYAKKRFGTSYRDFKLVHSIDEIEELNGQFDCITLIEVIEHLNEQQIRSLLKQASRKLKKNGVLLLSTPNYFSFWPLLEFIINRFSDVTYEEQHITRFTYLNFEKRLREIYPSFEKEFAVEFKTTSHFLAPFLAGISSRLAQQVSRMVNPARWRLPIGNLVFMKLVKAN